MVQITVLKIRIVKEKKEIKYCLFFTKEEVIYRVQINDSKILYTTYELNDAEKFKENYVLYHNSPLFIIEKNGMNKYRIKKRNNRIFRFSSFDFNITYSIYTEKNFSSLQEAEDFLDKEKKKNTWEKIKEVN